MGKVLFHIGGLKELRNRALKLDSKLRRKIYTKAVKAGGKIVVAEAQQLAPVRTGAVRRSIVHRMSSKPSKGLFGVKVTVKGGKLGLSSNRVARRKKGKRATYNPDAVERYYRFTELGTKYHPAKPYLKPSLEHTAPKVLEAIRSTMAAGIEEALR